MSCLLLYKCFLNLLLEFEFRLSKQAQLPIIVLVWDIRYPFCRRNYPINLLLTLKKLLNVFLGEIFVLNALFTDFWVDSFLKFRFSQIIRSLNYETMSVRNLFYLLKVLIIGDCEIFLCLPPLNHFFMRHNFLNIVNNSTYFFNTNLSMTNLFGDFIDLGRFFVFNIFKVHFDLHFDIHIVLVVVSLKLSGVFHRVVLVFELGYHFETVIGIAV